MVYRPHLHVIEIVETGSERGRRSNFSNFVLAHKHHTFFLLSIFDKAFERPDARRPLLLLAHLDVVEALKSDWSPDLDPFVFTEREGYYYGRGTADDKAMASIFVANVFRMKQEGYVPDRDIIIAAQTGAAERTARSSGIGRPSRAPAQTATV